MATYSMVSKPPDPWTRKVTLQNDACKEIGRFNRQMVKLTEPAPPWDVDSLQISVNLSAGLENVQVTCGGCPILAFTPTMLRKLPVVDDQIEILQPFLP